MIAWLEEANISYKENNPNSAAFVYALFGTAAVSLSSLIFKLANPIDSRSIIYYRSLLFLLFNNFVTLRNESKEVVYLERNESFWILVVRSLISSIGVVMLNASWQLTTLANATVIILFKFFKTLWLTLPIWNESLELLIEKKFLNMIRKNSRIIYCFFGIFLVVKPNFMAFIVGEQNDHSMFTGNMLALGSAIVFAIMSNIGVNNTKADINMQYVSVFTCIFSAICMITINVSEPTEFILNMPTCFIIIVVLTFLQKISLIFMEQALAQKSAFKLMPFSFVQLIFAFIFDQYLKKPEDPEPIDLLSILGTIIIVICSWSVLNRKNSSQA